MHDPKDDFIEDTIKHLVGLGRINQADVPLDDPAGQSALVQEAIDTMAAEVRSLTERLNASLTPGVQ